MSTIACAALIILVAGFFIACCLSQDDTIDVYRRQEAEWRARQKRLFEMQKETGLIFWDDCVAELERRGAI